MSDLINRQDAIDALDVLFQEHRYKIPGKAETYSQYNEAWQDALDRAEGAIGNLPSAEPKTDEESELRFYYVESIDDYWIGQRLDNFYYADWHKDLGFVWSKSRYLLWGEHIVDENTLWKEHTYPSEPIEIPFTEWIVGFVKKYYAEPKTGGWIPCSERLPEKAGIYLCTVGAPYRNPREMRYAPQEWADKSDNATWRNPNGGYVYDWFVEAWMPLPEPWRGADDED